MARQWKANILIDDVNHCRFQFVGVDVLRVDPAEHMRASNFRGMTRGLIRAEVAAVAKHGEEISLARIREFWISARWWPKMAGIAGPVFGVLENIEEMPLWHPGMEFPLEFRQSFGLGRLVELPQMWRAVFIDAQLAVGWKSRVDLGGQCRQFGLQHSRELDTAFGNAQSGAIGGQLWFAFRPGHELGAVIREFLRADDVEVAGFQGITEMDEDAHFQRASIKYDGIALLLDDKSLPSRRREAEIDFVRQVGAASMAVPADDGHRVQEAVVLGRRADVQKIEQLEQQTAMVGMNRPQQWQAVVILPAPHGPSLVDQSRDAALLGEKFSYLPPERGVAPRCQFGFQNLTKNLDQRLLDSTMFIVEIRQMFFRQSLGFSNASQHHFDQFIAAAHARLTQQREQQRLLLSRLGDVAHIPYVERGGFGGKLAQFGVGDALQRRIGINHASQPSEPVNPE